MSRGPNILAICSVSTCKIPTNMPKRWAKAIWSATSAWGACRCRQTICFPSAIADAIPSIWRCAERIRSDPFWVGGLDAAGYEAILEANRMIIGSPDTVIRKLRTVLSRVRPGILAVWTNDGSISHKDTMRCLELMGQEVLPGPAGDRHRAGTHRPLPENPVEDASSAHPHTRRREARPADVQEALVKDGDRYPGSQGRHGCATVGAPRHEGSPGWLRYMQALADHFTVYLPSHPGFDRSECPGWLNRCRPGVLLHLVSGTTRIGRHSGDWLFARWLARCRNSRPTRHAFSTLLLVDAVGIKRTSGEITDLFIRARRRCATDVFTIAPQVPEYDQLYGHDPVRMHANSRGNREMAVRLTWKPYMYDPRLPFLLARVTVPTRIVWGRQDKIIPVECGRLYEQAIPARSWS